MTFIQYMALELAVALAFLCLVFGLGVRHWRTMSPGRAVARILGWYLIVTGAVALLIALLDVPVPGLLLTIYVVAITVGYSIKTIAGDPWPLPRRPRLTSGASGAFPGES